MKTCKNVRLPVSSAELQLVLQELEELRLLHERAEANLINDREYVRAMRNAIEANKLRTALVAVGAV